MTATVKTPEQRAAELLTKIEEVFEGEDSLATVPQRIKALESLTEGVKGLDVKKIAEEHEKLKAQTEVLVAALRNRKGGIQFPGVEDTHKGFSMMRAVAAVAKQSRGDRDPWKDAPHEREVCENATKAAASIGLDTSAGYMVPDQTIAERIILPIYRRSKWIGLNADGETRISVLDGLTSPNPKIPDFKGGAVAGWIGESQSFPESELTSGDKTFNAKKAAVMSRVTYETAKWAGTGLERLWERDQVEALAALVDLAVPYGKGTAHQPRGIIRHTGIRFFKSKDGTSYGDGLTNSYATYIASSFDSGTFDFDAIENALLVLKENNVELGDASSIISSHRFFTWLKQLKVDNYSGQTTNRGYLVGMPMLTDAKLRELIGDYAGTNTIASDQDSGATLSLTTTGTGADNKHTDVFLGDMREVLMARWGGVEIATDNGLGLGFKRDETFVKMRFLCDLAVRQERRIIVCQDAKVRA